MSMTEGDRQRFAEDEAYNRYMRGVETELAKAKELLSEALNQPPGLGHSMAFDDIDHALRPEPKFCLACRIAAFLAPGT